MVFLVNKFRGWTVKEASVNLDRYIQHIEKNKKKLTENAFQFATAKWHYDPNDKRCPHDGWIESVILYEKSSGERNEIRRLEVDIIILGAYHNTKICFHYEQVKRYKFKKNGGKICQPGPVIAHGDWLVDEIGYSKDGFITHDILFSNDCKLWLEFKDICWEFVTV